MNASLAFQPHLYVARVILEATTALSIAAEGGGETSDAILATDANGLPALPGSALAGVLRGLHGRNDEATESLFGFQRGDEGRRSRLEVDWGRVLDSRGRPVDALVLDDTVERDSLLVLLAELAVAPRKRDRVALDHRGVVAGRRKYERSIVPAGTRFAVELRLWSRDPEAAAWQRTLALLSHPLFRLGGAVRSGLGALRVVALREAHLDLREPDDAERFRTLRSVAWETGWAALSDLSPPASTEAGVAVCTLSLQARQYWRIGQGNASLRPGITRDGKVPDLLPQSELRIAWSDGVATPTWHAPLFPASSLKGALAHRVAYLDNCRRGVFVETLPTDALPEWDKSAESPAVRTLFGCAREERQLSERSHRGQAGRVWFSDVVIDAPRATTQMHNVIDRFSGGVREHLLFEEELLYRTPMKLTVGVDDPDDLDPECAQLLLQALDDLMNGRLALGAASGRGHGWFKGSARWSRGGAPFVWPTPKVPEDLA